MRCAGGAFGYCSPATDFAFISESDYDAILADCYAFNDAYNAIDAGRTEANEKIDALASLNIEDKQAKIGFLNEWYIQSSLFADFALEPAGTLLDYRSTLSSYSSDIAYYQTASGR